MTVAIVGFLTSYADPLVDAWASTRFQAGDVYSAYVYAQHRVDDPYVLQALGIASVLLQAALLAATALLAARRWRLPFGALTLVLALDGVLHAPLHDQYALLPVPVVGGLLGDTLLRAVAVLLPVGYYLAYFAALQATGRIWWGVDLWLGSVVPADVLACGSANQCLLLPRAGVPRSARPPREHPP